MVKVSFSLQMSNCASTRIEDVCREIRRRNVLYPFLTTLDAHCLVSDIDWFSDTMRHETVRK